jgi:hypothetical protein
MVMEGQLSELGFIGFKDYRIKGNRYTDGFVARILALQLKYCDKNEI